MTPKKILKKFSNFRNIQKAFRLLPISHDDFHSTYLDSQNEPQSPQILLSNAIKKFCPKTFKVNQTTECYGIDIIPPFRCTEVLKETQRTLTERSNMESISRDTSLLFIKTSKKIDHKMFSRNLRSAYGKLAKKFCPKVTKMVMRSGTKRN